MPRGKKSVIQTCSICHGPIAGWGHNAQPVKDARCCDICNDIYVIPYRLALIMDKRKTEDHKNGNDQE